MKDFEKNLSDKISSGSNKLSKWCDKGEEELHLPKAWVRNSAIALVAIVVGYMLVQASDKDKSKNSRESGIELIENNARTYSICKASEEVFEKMLRDPTYEPTVQELKVIRKTFKLPNNYICSKETVTL